MAMNKEQVLELVDFIMHMLASSYRNEAREIVEEKFNSAAQSGPTNKQSAPCISCSTITTNLVRLCKSCEGNFE